MGLIRSAVAGASQAIDFQCQVRQGQIRQQAPQQCNDLDVCTGVRCAERFDTELMELPESPCLRPLMAEHRTEVEIFLWERIEPPDCAQ